MGEGKSEPNRERGLIIAIDGPAGSGKSTTARLLAFRLGYQFLDTGAMYRALTLRALQDGISISDGDRLSLAAAKMHITFEHHQKVNRVYVDGKDVTDAIRTPEVTKNVSEVAAHKSVRMAMVAKQKEIGRQGGIVAEGRDTTTVVFPHAEVKIYLEASVQERARRRVLDLQRLGIDSNMKEQRTDIERRDAYDSNREHSPLTRAADAHVVDTTNCTIEQQVDRILQLLDEVRK